MSQFEGVPTLDLIQEISRRARVYDMVESLFPNTSVVNGEIKSIVKTIQTAKTRRKSPTAAGNMAKKNAQTVNALFKMATENHPPMSKTKLAGAERAFRQSIRRKIGLGKKMGMIPVRLHNKLASVIKPNSFVAFVREKYQKA